MGKYAWMHRKSALWLSFHASHGRQNAVRGTSLQKREEGRKGSGKNEGTADNLQEIRNRGRDPEGDYMSNYHRSAARNRERSPAPAVPLQKDSGVLMSKATERRADLGSKPTNAEDGAAGGMGIRRDMQMIKNKAMREHAGYATTYDSNAKMKSDLRAAKNQKNQIKTRSGRSK